MNNNFYRKKEQDELEWERCTPYEKTVNPHDVIVDRDWNSSTPGFWQHKNKTKEEHMENVTSGRADNWPATEVSKYGDKYYIENDGNHRLAISQETNRPIKVNVTGEYVDKSQKQSQSMEEEHEQEMGM